MCLNSLPFVFFLFSLNADKRREELLLVGHQNQGIYQRIISRQSDYRRRLWLDDWERTERLRDNIMRYPRGPVEKQASYDVRGQDYSNLPQPATGVVGGGHRVL